MRMFGETARVTIGLSVLMVVFSLLSFHLHSERDGSRKVISIGPVLPAVLALPASFLVEVTNARTLLGEGGRTLRSDGSDTQQGDSLARRLFRMALLMALVGIPMWYFFQHLDRDEELKRLNAGLQARTEELAAANESLVVEVSERMRTEQSLEASRGDLRQLAAQLIRVQEEERQRIARDLHDDINQRLALLTIDVEALERQLSTAPTHTLRAVRAIEDRVIELSDDVRHLAHQLHPSILNDLGLSIALQRLVDDFTARTGVKSDFIDQESLKIRDQQIATCLYRVAQESLTNVSRHAKAKQVRIELSRLRDGLRLMISDDGVGFDRDRQRDKRERLGLLSMKERVALVGGMLDIESTEGEGTRVCAWVPLETQG
jgi:signal transduction histidine kinase